jgi:hypothetical protein
MQMSSTVRGAALGSVAAAISPTMSLVQIGVQHKRNAPSVCAVTHARIVPGSTLSIERGTVELRNIVIAAAGETGQASAAARIIDGTGLTVPAVNRVRATSSQ